MNRKTERESILVSACLLGEPCRYDGNSRPCPAVQALVERFELIPICPEQLGGLPTPRTPAEIQPDGRVVSESGDDVTAVYRSGARETLAIARSNSCRYAVLKANSPSCGVHAVYDGTFSGFLVPGRGVAAALLQDAGITVLDENDMAAGAL